MAHRTASLPPQVATLPPRYRHTFAAHRVSPTHSPHYPFHLTYLPCRNVHLPRSHTPFETLHVLRTHLPPPIWVPGYCSPATHTVHTAVTCLHVPRLRCTFCLRLPVCITTRRFSVPPLAVTAARAFHCTAFHCLTWVLVLCGLLTPATTCRFALRCCSLPALYGFSMRHLYRHALCLAGSMRDTFSRTRALALTRLLFHLYQHRYARSYWLHYRTTSPAYRSQHAVPLPDAHLRWFVPFRFLPGLPPGCLPSPLRATHAPGIYAPYTIRLLFSRYCMAHGQPLGLPAWFFLRFTTAVLRSLVQRVPCCLLRFLLHSHTFLRTATACWFSVWILLGRTALLHRNYSSLPYYTPCSCLLPAETCARTPWFGFTRTV